MCFMTVFSLYSDMSGSYQTGLSIISGVYGRCTNKIENKLRLFRYSHGISVDITY